MFNLVVLYPASRDRRRRLAVYASEQGVVERQRTGDAAVKPLLADRRLLCEHTCVSVIACMEGTCCAGWVELLIFDFIRVAPIPTRPNLIRTGARASGGGSHFVPTSHTSATTGCPERYWRRSPRWGSRWERGGSRSVPVTPPEWAAATAPGGARGLAACGGAMAGNAVATAVQGAAAAWAAEGPGATAAECPAVAASPGVGGAALDPAKGKGS